MNDIGLAMITAVPPVTGGPPTIAPSRPVAAATPDRSRRNAVPSRPRSKSATMDPASCLVPAPIRAPSRSATMKPALWRLAEKRGPGLPRPTTSQRSPAAWCAVVCSAMLICAPPPGCATRRRPPGRRTDLAGLLGLARGLGSGFRRGPRLGRNLPSSLLRHLGDHAKLGLDLGRRRRGNHVQHHRVGLFGESHAAGKFQVARVDDGPHRHLFHVHLDRGRDVGRLGLHGHLDQRLVEQAVGSDLAHCDDGDVDGHLLAAPHQEQVDVLDPALDGVPLHGLGQRHLASARHAVEPDQHVGGTQRHQHLVPGQADVRGLGAVPVQDGGHPAGPAYAAGRTLAELGPRLGGYVYLRHGNAPGVLQRNSASLAGLLQVMRPPFTWANGPTSAPAPMSAPSQNESMTVAPAPTTVSRSRQPAPTRAPAPTTVEPSSCVPGPMYAPGASRTPTSTQVLLGSATWTPALMASASSRALSTVLTRASCVRSFTP